MYFRVVVFYSPPFSPHPTTTHNLTFYYYILLLLLLNGKRNTRPRWVVVKEVTTKYIYIYIHSIGTAAARY